MNRNANQSRALDIEMISYSTNWMGPVSTRWYEKNNIPYVLKMSSGRLGPIKEYKSYTESYSCGRIDIYGLDENEYYAGKSEYRVSPMRTEDWNDFGEWLAKIECKVQIRYDTLIHMFEVTHKRKIRWANNEN